jgi:hypothetical protein
MRTRGQDPKMPECYVVRYPLILWITVLPPLSELMPLAAAERPSAASQ